MFSTKKIGPVKLAIGVKNSFEGQITWLLLYLSMEEGQRGWPLHCNAHMEREVGRLLSILYREDGHLYTHKVRRPVRLTNEYTQVVIQDVYLCLFLLYTPLASLPALL